MSVYLLKDTEGKVISIHKSLDEANTEKKQKSKCNKIASFIESNQQLVLNFIKQDSLCKSMIEMVFTTQLSEFSCGCSLTVQELNI